MPVYLYCQALSSRRRLLPFLFIARFQSLTAAQFFRWYISLCFPSKYVLALLSDGPGVHQLPLLAGS